jgi:hypothetical protein
VRVMAKKWILGSRMRCPGKLAVREMAFSRVCDIWMSEIVMGKIFRPIRLSSGILGVKLPVIAGRVGEGFLNQAR